MKTAVVFYSLDGNCALAAEEIKTLLNADLIRLQTMDEKKRGKIGKFFWAGGMMFSKKLPQLKPFTFNPSDYDLIIIGAPVWAGSPAAPVKTFITNAAITGKKIAIFVCHAGGMGDSLVKLKTLLTGNDIIAEVDFLSAAKNAEEMKKKVGEWVKEF